MNTLSLLSILLVLIALSAARPGRELRDADSEENRRPNGLRNLRQKMQRQRQQQQQQQNTEDSSSSSEEEEGEGETQDGSVLEIDPPQLSDLSSVVMGIESSLGDPALMVTTVAPEVEESGNVNETNNGEPGINIPQVGGKNPTTATETTKEVVCPSTCPLEFDPVCGTDDVTYPSLCVFEAIVCKDVSLNTTVAHRGSCLEKATTNVP